MMYLESFTFPNSDIEWKFIISIQRTCYDSFYPFKVLSTNNFSRIDFEPITILYGGNGSGKSTALNIIAEKTKIKRDSIYNKSNFFPNYVDLCNMYVENDIPNNSRIITSDDVFDYILNIRNINDRIDRKRENLFEEYIEAKYSTFQMSSMDDYEKLKKINNARKSTQSKFVRSELTDNIREYSNGENAFKYFIEKMSDGALYLLDEPENSLSPKRQMELLGFIEDSVRVFKCQFIISTHSPFFLSINGAKIYDLDENPVNIKRWTELENVQIYHKFFKLHDDEF